MDLLQDLDMAQDGVEVALNGGTVMGGGFGAWPLWLQVEGGSHGAVLKFQQTCGTVAATFQWWSGAANCGSDFRP